MGGKTDLQRRILITAYDYPNLTQAEIAERVDCSSSYVSSVLKQYDSIDAMEARIEQLNTSLGMDQEMTGSNLDIGPIFEESDASIDDLGPFGLLLVCSVFGGIFAYFRPLSSYSTTLQWGIVGACALGVVAVVGGAYRIYQKRGAKPAISWLLGNEFRAETDDRPAETEKTPPASQTLKDRLYFERADQRCEWCSEWIDSPEVHHITPRSEGGSNEPDNLTVLCPNCHRKADTGTISRSRLRYKIS